MLVSFFLLVLLIRSSSSITSLICIMWSRDYNTYCVLSRLNFEVYVSKCFMLLRFWTTQKVSSIRAQISLCHTTLNHLCFQLCSRILYLLIGWLHRESPDWYCVIWVIIWRFKFHSTFTQHLLCIKLFSPTLYH